MNEIHQDSLVFDSHKILIESKVSDNLELLLS